MFDILRKRNFFKLNGCLPFNKLVNLVLNSLNRRFLRSSTLVFNFLNFLLYLVDLVLKFILDLLLNITQLFLRFGCFFQFILHIFLDGFNLRSILQLIVNLFFRIIEEFFWFGSLLKCIDNLLLYVLDGLFHFWG